MQQRSRDVEDEPRYVIGMDAHSKQLSVSIWDWSDRFNARLHREIKCVNIEAMVATYERNVDLDSITVIEASNNSAKLKQLLNEAGYRAEVVRSDTIANKERKRKVCDIVDAGTWRSPTSRATSTSSSGPRPTSTRNTETSCSPTATRRRR